MTRRVPLAEVAEVNPRTPASLRDGDRSRLVPFLPMSAVSEEGHASYRERRPITALLKGYTYFARGDVLLAKITPCLENGKAALLSDLPDDVGFGSTEFHVLRPGPDVDPRYLFYSVWNNSFRRTAERNFTGTAGQKRLPASFFETYRILLPVLAEQRRIAAVLDKADAIRRKRRESMRLLDDEVLRSAFLEMFGDVVRHPGFGQLEPGWLLVTVDQIKGKTENACAGGPFGSTLTRTDYVSEPGVPVIRGNNLVADRGVFRDEDFVFVTERKAEELKRSLAFPGDVVFTQRGTLGQVAQIPRSARYSKYVVSQSQMKVTVNEEIVHPTYVLHYFLSPRARLDLESRTLQTGVPHINLRILRGFPVVLPPLDLQRRFAALVSRHCGVIHNLGRASLQAEELFLSLAQRTFT